MSRRRGTSPLDPGSSSASLQASGNDALAKAALEPVLAVTGLAREARIVAGPGVETVGAGGVPERLRALLAAREPGCCRAVLSIGIAGGLDPALKPGDLILATGIAFSQARAETAIPMREAIRGRLAALSGVRLVEADLAGVDAAVLSVSAKRDLRERTGAAAVDMESHVAEAFARTRGLPFGAIRVVCDPAERALPPFVATALKPNGEPDILAVLTALMRRQVRLGDLIRLARDSSAAFASLGRCRALLGFGLGVDP